MYLAVAYCMPSASATSFRGSPRNTLRSSSLWAVRSEARRGSPCVESESASDPDTPALASV